MFGDLKKIWAIFTASEQRKATWMLALIILMALAETGGVLSIMPFLSVLGRPAIIHESPWLQFTYNFLGFEGTRGFIIGLGLASITLVLVSSAFKTVTLHLVNRFVHLLRHSFSARLLSSYLDQPYEFFLTQNASVLSRNVLSEVDQMMFNLIQPLSQLIAQGAVVLAMVVLVFLYDPPTALAIIVVVGLLYGSIYGLVRRRLARIGAERQMANGRRFQSCNEALGGIKDVKVTHSAAAYQRKFDEASRTYSRHLAASDTLSQSPLYLVEAVGYSGLIIIALVLMLRNGDIARVLPALGLYGFAAYRMLPSVQIMYRGFAKLKFSSAALSTIHDDLLLPRERLKASDIALAPKHELRLERIRYAYPSSPDRPVFQDFSLVVPAGASVGIVGQSGAGKSTLMDLMLGLLKPEEGSVSVDGVRIDDHNVASWQRAIGYVPQHIYLADATVAENIAFGVPQKNIDMSAVERAARAACIHDFIIKELKDGYDTPLGERGIRLSGGQRQRVGIARALYRDPAVLFFDEATSAVDAQTEDALTKEIHKLPGSKTIVLITHREASLRGCDRVVNISSNSAETGADITLGRT